MYCDVGNVSDFMLTIKKSLWCRLKLVLGYSISAEGSERGVWDCVGGVEMGGSG